MSQVTDPQITAPVSTGAPAAPQDGAALGSTQAQPATKPSLFRKAYRELSDEEKAIVAEIKTKAEELEALLNRLPGSRYVSLAITSLEQAVMWAVKHVTG